MMCCISGSGQSRTDVVSSTDLTVGLVQIPSELGVDSVISVLYKLFSIWYCYIFPLEHCLEDNKGST